MKKIILFFIILSYLAKGQAPTLIADIQTKGNAEPSVTCNSNNKIYFTANNSVNGNELWRTDGSTANTYLVKDINPGPEPSGISEMVEYNGGIVFNAFTEVDGVEIWFSNGTEVGTIQIKDIFIGKDGSNPRNLTYFNGEIFFIAYDALFNICLYKTNGTALGTILVKNFGPIEFYGNLKVSSSVLFISIYDDNNNVSDLWKSDGTEAGTVLVKNIPNNGISSFTSDLAIYNLYFFTVTNGTNSTVWKSDGTSAGTTIVGTYAGETVLFQPSGFMSTGSGTYIFETNGIPTLIFSAPALCMEYDFLGKLYFMVENTALNRTELWVWIVSGPVKIKDFSNEGVTQNQKFLKLVNGTMYFNGHSFEHGEELWRTDGIFTEMVKDIRTGHYGSLCQNAIVLNNSFLFFANNGFSGLEPYISNGTGAGTSLIKDIQANDFDSNPTHFMPLGNSLFFTANSDDNPSTLFRYEPINGNVNSTLISNVSNSIIYNNKIYASALYQSGVELVLFNENLGSLPIADINAGPGSSYPAELTILGTKFIFAATDATGSRELWISDGTSAGTILINYTKFVPGSSDPRNITVVNNDLAYFFAKSGTFGEELWRTGGLATNTQRLTIAPSGPKIDASTKMGVLNNEVFFSASGAGNNYELWKSDGVQVILVKEINVGASGSFPGNFFTIGNSMFFYAYTATTGYELWKTDGTTAGTVLLRDINTQLSGGSNPDNFYNFNGILYFSADNFLNGTELWRSDGTLEGTYILKNINSTGGSLPREFCQVNNGLYFSANDGKHGFELWKTDGTDAGTLLVFDTMIDINASNTNFVPSSLYNHNGTLFFAARDSYYGVEPHLYKPCLDQNKNIPGSALLPSQTLNAIQTLQANNSIFMGNSVNYVAGKSITLSPGFKAGDGINPNTVFRAEIRGCY